MKCSRNGIDVSLMYLHIIENITINSPHREVPVVCSKKLPCLLCYNVPYGIFSLLGMNNSL